MQQANPVIVWFRRDLRLGDNLALHAAVQSGQPIVCVYIRDSGDRHAGALGAAQAWWLHHSLKALAESLQRAGNQLILRSGSPNDILLQLVKLTGAGSVFWNRRYDADGIAVDTKIKSGLRARGVDAQSFSGFLMHEPPRILTKQNKPFRVFTPFWKAFESGFHPNDTLPAAAIVPSIIDDLPSEALEDWQLLPLRPNWALTFSERWQPGEAGAVARLSSFLQGHLRGYREKRDFPAVDAVSGLSPHLAMGEISPDRLWNATNDHFSDGDAAGAAFFRRELVWRDFAWNLLFYNPDMPRINQDRRFDAFPWRQDDAGLAAWQRGKTGYPIVDAGMRELWQTGVMHNRVRMVAASFLIKHLLIDWREGERWFRDTLVDIDCASNAMNWQWVAGCGADASPWFRIFNPIKQGETFDTNGDYVRRYCPELAALPNKYLHRPFEAPISVLRDAGIELGTTYPKPIVDHDTARQRALAALKGLPKDLDA